MKIPLKSFFLLFAASLTLSLSAIRADDLKEQNTTPPAETTPATIPGAETFVYRNGKPEPMRLHVFKPSDWKADDKRPALIWFFGGGWTKGTPLKSAGWARSATQWGMVGIAPDYRTKNRFNTSPLEAVADGRAALRWVQDHASELGIDPEKIIVGGGSAGGHLALWTGIEGTPPGSDASEAPKDKPLALILHSPVSDTSRLKGYTPKRFGNDADALSPVNRLDAKMPSILLFHGDADEIVPYAQSVELNQKLVASGNSVEFITVPGGSHSFVGQTPGWKDKTKDIMEAFLRKLGVVSVPEKP